MLFTMVFFIGLSRFARVVGCLSNYFRQDHRFKLSLSASIFPALQLKRYVLSLLFLSHLNCTTKHGGICMDTTGVSPKLRSTPHLPEPRAKFPGSMSYSSAFCRSQRFFACDAINVESRMGRMVFY